MKAVLLLLGCLVLALGRPIPQDDPRDPDGSRWRTAFPKMTTTTATMANTTLTEKKEDPVPIPSATTSLSRVADLFEILGSVLAIIVFLGGCILAVKKYCDEVRENPGEIAQACERLIESLRNLAHRRQ